MAASSHDPDSMSISLLGNMVHDTATPRDTVSNDNATIDDLPRDQTTEHFGGNSRLVIHDVGETESPQAGTKMESGSKVVLVFNSTYVQTCPGMLRVLQVLLSATTLIVLTTSHGVHFESYLLLPTSNYYRVMVFILVASMLLSTTLLFAYTCELTKSIPYNWPLLDCIVHTFIAVLYMVGTTLIACTHDFYHKPKYPFTPTLSTRLLVVVVLGYVTMIVFALTAFHGHQKWKRVIPYRFQQQPLLEDLEHLEI